MAQQDIDKLVRFFIEFKNKKPDYVILSKEKYTDLCFELQAPNLKEYKGMQIVVTHYAGKDFLQVGFGTP